MWDELQRAISDATHAPFVCAERRPLGGGCISEAHAIRGTDGRTYFVKSHDSGGVEMFSAEMDGLNELRAARAVRIPTPICTGRIANHAFLVMEFVPLGGPTNYIRLGRELAMLHRRVEGRFGWFRDNTIGATAQGNEYDTDWVRFLAGRRFGVQLRLAKANGAGTALLAAGDDLVERLGEFFSSYSPAASLLHGDLWSGNCGFDSDGAPVIFDPAVYYGDRESDLAMTELFGGFPSSFYAAYQEVWPLDPGYEVRKQLYQLYHVLNHFNLFGGSYQAQSASMARQLLTHLGARPKTG